MNTQRNNPVNLQYKCLLNSHEDFMSILQDFMYILLSMTVHDIESTVQIVQTKGNPVNSAAFSY